MGEFSWGAPTVVRGFVAVCRRPRLVVMGHRSLTAAALSFWLESIEMVAARSFTVAALLLLAWVDSIRRRSSVRWVG